MRLLCLGDTHVGAWPKYADRRVDEQEHVLHHALMLAAEHGCEGVLFAGDATHEPRPAPEHYLAFARPFRDARLPVLAISGNSHDTRSAELPIPLEVFADEGLFRLSRTPELIDFCDLAVATLPWVPVARLVAAENGGDRDTINDRAAELLLATARGLRAKAAEDHPHVPAVLMLHWSVSGAATPDGADVGLFREPVLDLGELEAMHWDAVVMGHIHKAQVLDDEGRIFYVGSPMPLNFGEAGCEHGAWLLDFDGDSMQATFHPIESRRFLTLDFALASDQPMETSDAYTVAGEVAYRQGASIDGAIVKVRFGCTAEQARAIDPRALQAMLLRDGAHRAYVEPDIVRVDRARVEGLDEDVDDTRALEMWVEANAIDEQLAARLRDRHAMYAERVGA